jgi:carboxypeptidase family protein
MVARYSRIVALLLAGCACMCAAQEHTAALLGTVRGNGGPLPEVRVLLQSSDSSRTLADTITTANGTFLLAGLTCGNDFSLLLSRSGWRTRRITHLQVRCASTLIMAQGRTHFDRAFTGKVSGYYAAPLASTSESWPRITMACPLGGSSP